MSNSQHDNILQNNYEITLNTKLLIKRRSGVVV